MSVTPNILFIFPDQWRWDWVGCERKVPVRTPHMDAIAAGGMRFTQCRTNSPLCGPARACLAQGVRYHRAGVVANAIDMDVSRPTYFQQLRAAGYQVATCGKNDLHKRTHWSGLDGWMPRLGRLGFTRAIDQSDKRTAARAGSLDKSGPFCAYTSMLHREGAFDAFREDHFRRLHDASLETATWPTPLPRRLYSDDFCGRSALRLLDDFPEDGPWFLWVNFPGPHDPMDPPRQLQQRYDDVQFDMPVNPKSTYRNDPNVNHLQVRRNYAAEIEGIDEWVGRIVDRIAQRGELDDTIIVISSDHGEMLGDHGRFTKHVAKEGSAHVPLIVAGPGVRRGATSDALVELIDIAATTLDVAGLATPAHYDARSLAPILHGDRPDAAHRDVQTAQLTLDANAWRMLFDGRYKLIVHDIFGPDANDPQTPPFELYDLEEDPYEQHNLADAMPQRVKSMKQRLEHELNDSAES